MHNPAFNIAVIGTSKEFNLSLIRQKTFPLKYRFIQGSLKELASMSKDTPALVMVDWAWTEKSNENLDTIKYFIVDRRKKATLTVLIFQTMSSKNYLLDELQKSFSDIVKLKLNGQIQEDNLILELIQFSDKIYLSENRNVQKQEQVEKEILNDLKSIERIKSDENEIVALLKMLISKFKSDLDIYAALASACAAICKDLNIEHFVVYQNKIEGLFVYKTSIEEMRGLSQSLDTDCSAAFSLSNGEKILVNDYSTEMRVGSNPLWPRNLICTSFTLPIVFENKTVAFVEFLNAREGGASKKFKQHVVEAIEKLIHDFLNSLSAKNLKEDLEQIFSGHLAQREKFSTMLVSQLQNFIDQYGIDETGIDLEWKSIVNSYSQAEMQLNSLLQKALLSRKNRSEILKKSA